MHRGIESLTTNGKKGDEELSVHGHVNISFADEDDPVLAKLNALVRVVGDEKNNILS